MDRRRKVLLALPSHTGSALFKEVLKQLDFHLQIDCVWNASELPGYLKKHASGWPPGLIVFESLPVQADLSSLLEVIRSEGAYLQVPVAVFAWPEDLSRVGAWAEEKGVSLFPRTGKPSELKYSLARSLGNYSEPGVVSR